MENRKNENYKSTLRIRIGLGSKFKLKWTIFFFKAKFSQKGFLQSKRKNVNTTAVYKLRVFEAHSAPWGIFGLESIDTFCPIVTHFGLGGIRKFWAQKLDKENRSQRF